MSKEKPQIAIIIVNYNASELLKQCLQSLENNLKMPREICVVDNASIDGSMSMVRETFPSVLRVSNSTNRGFASAINQGIRETEAPFIFWLNPDSECLDNGLKELVQYMEEHSEIAAVGPKILNPDKSVQLSCRAFPSYMNYLFGRHSILTKLFPRNPFSQEFLLTDMDHDQMRQVDWVSGAAFLHRRSLLSEVGWLDEGYFMYFEEVDLCQRIKKAGGKVMFHPGAKFVHHIAGSAKKVSYRTTVIRQQSNWRYYTKHFKRNRLKDLFIAAGLTVKCCIQLLILVLPKKKK